MLTSVNDSNVQDLLGASHGRSTATHTIDQGVLKLKLQSVIVTVAISVCIAISTYKQYKKEHPG